MLDQSIRIAKDDDGSFSVVTNYGQWNEEIVPLSEYLEREFGNASS